MMMSKKTTKQLKTGAPKLPQAGAAQLPMTGAPDPRDLMAWWDENKRDLPWRRDPSPYHVWLSEIMLQQTRVEAVKGYYERFLAALPTLSDLAVAEEDTCLKLWEGLGYYSRVRNLRKGAVFVMEELGGEIPSSYDALLKLPGVGPYTAAAIASMAFGEAVPAVDGNLLRVFARVTGCGEDILKTGTKKLAESFFEGIIDRDRPGAFNQALMDLGATVCLPNTAPRCGECPWKDACAAHAEGRETELPVRIKKQKKTTEKMTVLLIRHGDRIVLRKRPEEGLLAGLYEFPNVPGHLTQKEAAAATEELGFTPLRLTKLPPAKHIFSHKVWDMTAYEIRADEWQDLGEDGPLFTARVEDIRDLWSIPSAFAAYRDPLLGE